MYTFAILVIGLFILSGAIFGKNIKQNLIPIASIIFIGTFIGTTIVNGVIGLDIPLTTVLVKQRPLEIQASNIYSLDDTTHFYSYIEYDFTIDSDNDTSVNHIDVNGWTFYRSETDELAINFLPEGDTIPYVEVFKGKRLVDNNWITAFGLPGSSRTYVVYIPNDSIHNVLVNHINEKYYRNEKQEIAKLN